MYLFTDWQNYLSSAFCYLKTAFLLANQNGTFFMYIIIHLTVLVMLWQETDSMKELSGSQVSDFSDWIQN